MIIRRVLRNIQKPCVVYAKNAGTWYQSSSFIIKDGTGKLISLDDDKELESLINKYNIGDTIK